jgi:hypothetical protein
MRWFMMIASLLPAGLIVRTESLKEGKTPAEKRSNRIQIYLTA